MQIGDRYDMRMSKNVKRKRVKEGKMIDAMTLVSDKLFNLEVGKIAKKYLLFFSPF